VRAKSSNSACDALVIGAGQPVRTAGLLRRLKKRMCCQGTRNSYTIGGAGDVFWRGQTTDRPAFTARPTFCGRVAPARRVKTS
jgi:hypothetical protein